ncbi:radical SAM protein [Cytobacillus sp. Hm23]
MSFYGGEPLLNWKIIQNAVEYTKNTYKQFLDNIFFSITTNAYLLTEDKINYMLDNNFSISVSIDGDRENHDRNRVTINNRGTFDRIFNNLILIEKMFKEKMKMKKPVLPYGILMTYDNLTEFTKLDAFFSENTEIDKRIQRVTRVSDMNTDYYDSIQMKPSMINKRKKFLMDLIEKAKSKDFEENSTNFSRTVLKGVIFEPMMNLAYNNNELRGTCFPGINKLAVDSNGDFHMCEKINPSYPVGNVEEGLDLIKQVKYMNDFFKALEKCENCNLKNICNLCYVSTEIDGQGFQIQDEFCTSFREGIINSFSTFYSIMENNPDLFREIRD